MVSKEPIINRERKGPSLFKKIRTATVDAVKSTRLPSGEAVGGAAALAYAGAHVDLFWGTIIGVGIGFAAGEALHTAFQRATTPSRMQS